MARTFIYLICLITSFGFAKDLPKFYDSTCILNGKIDPNNHRFKTFATAFRLMQQRRAQTLVETGTARFGRSNCGGDGCSTLLFAEWASQNNGFLYSVDINKEYLQNAELALENLVEFTELVCSDSIEFLRNFNQQIDFLYLDSYDFDDRNPNPSQQHHLNEIIAAYPWLTKNSIVMIDDCGLAHGGKGRLVINYLLKRNWKIVIQEYQVILVQGDSVR